MWLLFLYSIGQSWGKWREDRFGLGQLFVGGDVCGREKELEFKDAPMYFSGLYLGAHRSNQIYPL